MIRHWRPALVLAFALLVVLKMPNIFWEGRFWAEEGSVFYPNALQKSWYGALTAVHTGYLQFIADAATLLAAHLARIEQAPRVSSVVALFFQTCPALLLALGGLPWLRRPLPVAVALLIPLLLPPAVDEIWANAITSQFHLTLCAAIILASDLRRDAWRWFEYGLLVLAPLAGPGAIFVAPLFVLRVWVERAPQRLLQAVLICVSAIVQLAVVATHPEPDRSIGISLPILVGTFLVKHIMMPFLGRSNAEEESQRLYAAVVSGTWPLWPGLAVGAWLMLLGGAVMRWGTGGVRWLLAAALVVATLSYVGALGGQRYLLLTGFGGRYAFVPGVLLALTLLGLAATKSTPRVVKVIAGVLLGVQLVVGVPGYLSPDPGMAMGPSWSGQIAAWRQDPSTVITLWPPSFKLWLGPDNRRP